MFLWYQIAVIENNILRGVLNVFGMFSGIDELLAQDTSSYQLFHSLPKEMQEKIVEHDFTSFYELNRFVQKNRHKFKG